jgi:hypothetical protein
MFSNYSLNSERELQSHPRPILLFWAVREPKSPLPEMGGGLGEGGELQDHQINFCHPPTPGPPPSREREITA